MRHDELLVYGLPQVAGDAGNRLSTEYLSESLYTPRQLDENVQNDVGMLNNDENVAYYALTETGRYQDVVFILDYPDGTAKSFVTTSMLSIFLT